MNNLDNIFEPEDLHEELAAYIEEGGVLGQMLRHPLVYQIPYMPAMNRMSNLMFAQKTKALEQAVTDETWGKYIFLHERPYRLDALEKIMFEYGVEDPTVIWPLVASIWTDSENINQNLQRWRDIWEDDLECRELCMYEKDRLALIAMPETLKVFRGVGHKNATHGLSWTVDRSKAVWFAKRFARGDKTRTPILVEGTVQRSEVIAYYSDRGESEIVTFPEDVDILRTERI